MILLDTDLVIQQKGGGLLKEIIARIGNDGFKQLEEDVNASIDVNKSVIAPGGSAVYSDKAMRHFKEIGTIIYLKLDYQTVKRRLGNLKARGGSTRKKVRHYVTCIMKEFHIMKNTQISQ